MRGRLQAAMDLGRVHFAAGALEQVDGAGVQLLCALVKSARGDSREVCWDGISETLREQDLDILATDIDSSVLRAASGGVYAEERIRGIDDRRLRRWFLWGKGANAGSVKLKPGVSRLVRFGQLNLAQGGSMGHPLDVIFCRNVIIYFGKEDKIRLVDRYADNLRPAATCSSATQSPCSSSATASS